jgi:hypothetical protein
MPYVPSKKRQTFIKLDNKNKMNQITSNWKTTLFGVIVFGLGIYLGVTGQIEWSQIWAFVAAGIGLFVAKDGDK